MTRRVAGVGVVAAAGLVLAGCGGTSPSPTASPSVGATSAAPSATVKAASPTGSVAIIGDSLTYQNGNGQKDMTARLEAAGWPRNKICWSGVDGRTIADTLPGGAPSSQMEVARCRKAVGEPAVWIIALETNDLGEKPATVRVDMAKVLAVLGPKAKVLWVNAGRQDLTTQQVLTLNPVVAQVVASRPNSRLADWFGFLKAHPKQDGWWQADGTHMTRAGYLQRNTFIAEQARQFATS